MYPIHQVVMWDNRSLSHKGLADDVSQRRVVHRVSIRGSAPVNHRGQAFSGTRVRAANAALFDFDEHLDRSKKPLSYSNGVKAAM